MSRCSNWTSNYHQYHEANNTSHKVKHITGALLEPFCEASVSQGTNRSDFLLFCSLCPGETSLQGYGCLEKAHSSCDIHDEILETQYLKIQNAGTSYSICFNWLDSVTAASKNHMLATRSGQHFLLTTTFLPLNNILEKQMRFYWKIGIGFLIKCFFTNVSKTKNACHPESEVQMATNGPQNQSGRAFATWPLWSHTHASVLFFGQGEKTNELLQAFF